MAARDELVNRYSESRKATITNQGRELTPAEFMLTSNPGPHKVHYKGRDYYSRYSNAGSASRAYRKVKAGDTTGEKMLKQGDLYTYRAPGLANNEPGGFVTAPPRGGYQMGLWKVIVHMNWTDVDGKEHVNEERSFIVQSDKYNSYYDANLVLAETNQAIEEHVASWEDEYGVGDVEIVYVEAIRIQTTTKTYNHIVEIE